MPATWPHQLVEHLRSREGAGALVIATSSAVALGVVPNLIDALPHPIWAAIIAFVVTVLITPLGWALRHERGLGIVLGLYPPGQQQDSRIVTLAAASAARHTSSFEVRPRLLSPAGTDLGAKGRADLTAEIIDARAVEEARRFSATDVTLYPLIPLREGFHLGRQLANRNWTSLTVMHLSGSNAKSVIPGVRLGTHLTGPLTPAQLALVNDCVHPSSGDAITPEPHPECPRTHRHRLAVIIRLSPSDAMVEDALHVARTGSLRRPYSLAHTGYLPHIDATCGAHVVIESTRTYLDEAPETFEALANHLHRTITTVAEAWRNHLAVTSPTPHRPVDVLVFLAGPLPIAIALGWLGAHHPETDLVHHDKALMGSWTEPSSTGRL